MVSSFLCGMYRRYVESVREPTWRDEAVGGLATFFDGSGNDAHGEFELIGLEKQNKLNHL